MHHSFLSETTTSREYTTVFYGINRSVGHYDGEFYSMKNMGSNMYPAVSPRPKRGLYTQIDALGIESVKGMIGKTYLAFVGTQNGEDWLYYQEQKISSKDGGNLLKQEYKGKDRQLISMGAYLLVFPDAVYLNTQDLTDKGTLSAKYEYIDAENPITVSYTLDTLNDVDYSDVPSSATAPEDKNNGDFWIDTSQVPTVLRVWSESSGMWLSVGTTYVKIEVNGVTGFKDKFSKYDAVTIKGTKYKDINKDGMILYDVGDNYITVVGIIDSAGSEKLESFSIERKVPEMDFVCECNNRIWGCKYGVVDGKTVNEIYSSAQGDAKNWYSYRGIASDSYALSIGSDGVFTGCINYGGYPTFFKENYIYRIYGAYPAAFQLSTDSCRGVKKGCSKSLCVVNERLFYVSVMDVCYYDGSLPSGISKNLGFLSIDNAVAGALGGKYYLSCENDDHEKVLVVYDSERGVWHMEDNTVANCFANWKNTLFFSSENKIFSVTGIEGESLEDQFEWEAITTAIGYSYPDKKYLSRFDLRLAMNVPDDGPDRIPSDEEAYVEVYIKYDGRSDWIFQKKFTSTGKTESFVCPVKPRRCDHINIKIKGKGNVVLRSLSKILEVGSDY